ncbi:MAG TPA: thermonuclease family protein [Methylococcaceae bacterium]|nr:thermonuclease family protein [Methylococcaceae bacterium]
MNHLKHTTIVSVIFLAPLFFAASNSIGADYYLVTRAVDGNTIVLANKDRVRLIGVDTPELHHPRKPVQYYAEEAYRFTQKIVEGKKVRLESTTGKGGIVTAASWPLSISPTTPSSTPS